MLHGIFTHIWLRFMVNVGKYWDSHFFNPPTLFFQPFLNPLIWQSFVLCSCNARPYFCWPFRLICFAPFSLPFEGRGLIFLTLSSRPYFLDPFIWFVLPSFYTFLRLGPFFDPLLQALFSTISSIFCSARRSIFVDPFVWFVSPFFFTYLIFSSLHLIFSTLYLAFLILWFDNSLFCVLVMQGLILCPFHLICFIPFFGTFLRPELIFLTLSSRPHFLTLSFLAF